MVSDAVNENTEGRTIENEPELEEVEIFSVGVEFRPLSNEFWGAYIK